MEVKYVCEVCDMQFSYRGDCYEHEKECSSSKIFECDKCGTIIEWDSNNELDEFIENECWNVDLGVAGYGSLMDGGRIDFNMCDECLKDLVMSFTLNGLLKLQEKKVI